jgi:hypothetical protein
MRDVRAKKGAQSALKEEEIGKEIRQVIFQVLTSAEYETPVSVIEKQQSCQPETLLQSH